MRRVAAFFQGLEKDRKDKRDRNQLSFLSCESFMSFLNGRDFVNWGAIRIWAAILLLLDASFGLWNHQRFEKSLPKINIAKIALIEALVALILLIVHALF